MKIEVAKADLEVALSVAKIAVGSGGSDLSTHYLFRIHKGAAQVLSTNSQIFALSPLVANVEGDDGDAFTVESWRLDKWVAGVGDGSLTLSYDGKGDVKAAGPRSKVRFRSLDPSKFPFWDKSYKTAESVGEMSPRALANALSLTKGFVSADDTQKPELCQVEAIDGVLSATDRRALCLVKVGALPDLSIRVPGKAIGSVIKFLTDKHTVSDDVDVLETDTDTTNFAIFLRADGSYLGVTRPVTKFPTLKVDREATDDAEVIIDREEFDAAISVLSAGAPKGHEMVTFSYDQDGNTLNMTMPCEAGGDDSYPLSTAIIARGEKFDTDFTVFYPYIRGVSDSFGLEQIKFGVNKRGRGGFITFRHEDEGVNGNEYFSVVVWRT